MGLMKINLPKDWSEITLSQFQQITTIQNVANATDIMQDLEILSILSDTQVDTIANISIKDLKKLNQAISLMSELPSSGIIDKIVFDKKTYYFNHKLNDLMLSQYIDLCTYTKNNNDIIHNAHRIMTIFVSQKGQEYTMANIEKNAELFKEMPMSVVYPMVVFFCNLYNNFVSAIRDYLELQTSKEMIEIEKMLTELGIPFRTDGSGSSS